MAGVVVDIDLDRYMVWDGEAVLKLSDGFNLVASESVLDLLYYMSLVDGGYRFHSDLLSGNFGLRKAFWDGDEHYCCSVSQGVSAVLDDAYWGFMCDFLWVVSGEVYIVFTDEFSCRYGFWLDVGAKGEGYVVYDFRRLKEFDISFVRGAMFFAAHGWMGRSTCKVSVDFVNACLMYFVEVGRASGVLDVLKTGFSLFCDALAREGFCLCSVLREDLVDALDVELRQWIDRVIFR